MNVFEAAKGRWSEILPTFGITNEVGTNKHSECPICGKKKFRIDNKEGSGSYICVCSSGYGYKLIERATGLDSSSILKGIKDIIGYDEPEEFSKPKINLNLDTALKDWKRSVTLAGTPAEKYLNNRGIWIMPKGGVKWIDSIKDSEYGELSAMYAIASNEKGEPVYRHVTYLRGREKADVEKSKKMLTLQKKDGSVAIKLFPHQTTLGIAEGIETALSVNQQFKCPCWATLNASLMKKFRAPKGVDHLIIWADRDRGGTGLAAAFECGRANIYASNDIAKVTIKWTERVGDFNDYIFHPSTINEMVLSR